MPDLISTFTYINETLIEVYINDTKSRKGNDKWAGAVCNISGFSDVVKHEYNPATDVWTDTGSLNYGPLVNFGLPTSWCDENNNEGFNLFSAGTGDRQYRLVLPSGDKMLELLSGEGTEEVVLVYQNTSVVNYQSSWFDLNVTLFLEHNGNWNNTISDIFVFDNVDKKFGANVTGFNSTQKFRYVLNSSYTISQVADWRFKLLRTDKVSCGSVGCKATETHDINFFDICRYRRNETVINLTTDTVDGTLLFSPNCSFTQPDSNSLEVEFFAEYDPVLDMIPIDPIIVVDDVDSYDSINHNVTSEGYPLSHASTGSDDVYANLMLYMPFDFENRSTTVYDYTENSNDGTLTGDPIFNGTHSPYEGSYRYTSNDYTAVASDPSIEGMDELTLMAWIDPTNPPGSGWGRIIHKAQGSTGDDYALTYNLAANTGCANWASDAADLSATIRINTASGVRTICGTTTIAVEAGWTHVAVTWNKSAQAIWIYINGTLDKTDSNSIFGGNLDDSNEQMGIGRHVGSDVRNFNGFVDEAMVFNKTLSDQQILDIYNNQSARFEQPATQLFPNVNFTAGDNRVNVTYNAILLQGTNLSLRLREYSGGTWTANTSWFNLSDGDNLVQNYSITNGTNNLTLEFNFITHNGNQSGNFYSPVLRDNIIVTTWGVEEEGAPAGAAHVWNVTQAINSVSEEEKTPAFRRSLNQEFSLVSLMNRLASLRTRVFQELVLNSAVGKTVGLSTSVAQELIVGDDISRIVSFNRNPVQEFILTGLVEFTATVSLTVDVVQEFLFFGLPNRLFSGTTGVSQELVLDDSVSKTTGRLTSVVQELSVTSVVDRLYSGNRNPVQQITLFALTNIQKTGETIVDITQEFNLFALSNRLFSTVDNVVERINLFTLSDRMAGRTGVVVQELSVFGLSDRLFSGFTSVNQQIVLFGLTDTEFTSVAGDAFTGNVSQEIVLNGLSARLGDLRAGVDQLIRFFSILVSPITEIVAEAFSSVTKIVPNTPDVPYVHINKSLSFN